MKVKIKLYFQNSTWPYLAGEDIDLGIEETGVLYYVLGPDETLASYQNIERELPGVVKAEIIMEE